MELIRPDARLDSIQCESVFSRGKGYGAFTLHSFSYWIIVGGLVIRADGNPALARGLLRAACWPQAIFTASGIGNWMMTPVFSPGSAIRTPSAIRTGIGALSNSRPTNTKLCKKSIPRSRSWRTTISSPTFAAVSLRAERSCWSPGQCEWTRSLPKPPRGSRPIRQNGHEIKKRPEPCGPGQVHGQRSGLARSFRFFSTRRPGVTVTGVCVFSRIRSKDPCQGGPCPQSPCPGSAPHCHRRPWPDTPTEQRGSVSPGAELPEPCLFRPLDFLLSRRNFSDSRSGRCRISRTAPERHICHRQGFAVPHRSCR